MLCNFSVTETTVNLNVGRKVFVSYGLLSNTVKCHCHLVKMYETYLNIRNNILSSYNKRNVTLKYSPLMYFLSSLTLKPEISDKCKLWLINRNNKMSSNPATPLPTLSMITEFNRINVSLTVLSRFTFFE